VAWCLSRGHATLAMHDKVCTKWILLNEPALGTQIRCTVGVVLGVFQKLWRLVSGPWGLGRRQGSIEDCLPCLPSCRMSARSALASEPSALC
jgi:hypothetical protein